MIGSWPQLQGPLVRLRPPAPGDEPALIEMATDALVRRYIGGPDDLATATAKAPRKVTTPDPGDVVIVARASGAVAGSGSLARKRGPWEICYMLRRTCWGRGQQHVKLAASPRLAPRRCVHSFEARGMLCGDRPRRTIVESMPCLPIVTRHGTRRSSCDGRSRGCRGSGIGNSSSG